MTPLEIAAKAICDYENTHGKDAPVDFDYIRSVPGNQHCIWYTSMAQSVIAAVKDCPLSEQMKGATSALSKTPIKDCEAEGEVVFRAMLDAIINPELY